MSVDEIRRLPPSTGLLAYRNRRSVLLDLAGWDERADARAIKTGKRETEQEQQRVFDSNIRSSTVPESETVEPAEAVTEE
jgi:hypothetical protein